jgi:hypothetical protein
MKIMWRRAMSKYFQYGVGGAEKAAPGGAGLS